MKRNVELGFLDHMLVLVACSTSLYCLGESLGKHTLSLFLAIAASVSILTGFFVSRVLGGRKVREWDGYLWTVLAFGAALFSRQLNLFLPEEGFPFMLFAGTWLSWMILMCGLVSWRDQTLLFLNLPCLTVFALVGTFDTFAPATVLFFVFLVCSSLLYARIHQRGMIRRAKLAGQEDPSLLERDAWRWMAGPEWAFASAGVIVLLSLLFGPILRFSLQPVSGTVKVSLPQSPTTNPAAAALDNTEVQVGKGALNLGDDVAFRVSMRHPDYLRTGFMTEYMGNGWTRLRAGNLYARLGIEPLALGEPDEWVSRWPKGPPLEPMAKSNVRELALKGPANVPTLPAPGPVASIYLTTPGVSTFAPSGLVYRRVGIAPGEVAKVRYHELDEGVNPGVAEFPEEIRELDSYFLEIGKAPQSVVDFARRASAPGRTDFERATLIKNAIERAAGYTLKAPALSPTSDAVEQFLFTTKKGYCDLFATAMVVCARTIGLPARYAVGYLVTDFNRDDDGYYVVRSRDSHAWAEVFFKDAGWVKFDATEGAQVVEDEPDQRTLPWYRQRWAPYAFSAFFVALAAGGGWFVRTRFAPRPSPRGVQYRSAASRIHHESTSRSHQAFDRAVRKATGVGRRFSQTTTEYVALVLPKLGDMGSKALVLVAELEGACFGPRELGRGELQGLARRVREFGRELARARRA